MGAVYFYHLTRTDVAQTLPMLLEKTLAAGWRAYVASPRPERLSQLDQHLWTYRDESFLPHAMEGGAQDHEQPVLLGGGGEGAPANGATCLFCLDAQPLTPEQAQGSARACILFDGGNEEAVQHARTQWRALTAAGCEAVYWAQEGGDGWVRKAQHPPPPPG